MKTQLYPAEYVESLSKLAAAGQTLAHELERRNTTDPLITSALRRHKTAEDEHEAVYRGVVQHASGLLTPRAESSEAAK